MTDTFNQNKDSNVPENTDARLTGYLLNELEPEERVTLEKELEENPALRNELDAFQKAIESVESAFRAEPLPTEEIPQARIISKTKETEKRNHFRIFVPSALALLIAIVIFTTFPQPLKQRIVKEKDSVAKKILDQGGPLSQLASPQNDELQNGKLFEARPSFSSADKEYNAVKAERATSDKNEKPSSPVIHEKKKLRESFFRDRSSVANQRSEMILLSEENHSYAQPNKSQDVFGVATTPRVPKDPHVLHLEMGGEEYTRILEKSFLDPKKEPFSTFSIDVDTASYSNMRRFINAGRRPPEDAIKIEEMVNYFRYGYSAPTKDSSVPFATHVDVASCPWAPKNLLVRIGLKGKEIAKEDRPPLHLVFLIDISGSMRSSNKLPLVKKGLMELVEELTDQDKIAIVVYAGATRVHLASISGNNTAKINASIDELKADGSTAGSQGIETAYRIARAQYDTSAINRVILCTDGDFNVGSTNNQELEKQIQQEAKSGVCLTVLGFGMGNYKDNRLAILSNKGNGNYGYIDSLEEARRLLVDNLTGTLITIAKDVKIQIDFNPNRVAGYRLLGYDDRRLAAEDFHNDKKDAGEIGAGHTVTALYEIVPMGVEVPDPNRVDRSRYMKKEDSDAKETKQNSTSEFQDELMFVKLRYKLPKETKSKLLSTPIVYKMDSKGTPSADFQFAAAVALFGQILRESSYISEASFDQVIDLATPSVSIPSPDPWKKEFVELVRKTKQFTPSQTE